jgi:hypothetical protein
MTSQGSLAQDAAASPLSTQTSADPVANLDRYMANVDRALTNSTIPLEPCPYHQHLLSQTHLSMSSKCCVLHAWLQEDGHKRSAIVCLADNQWLSVSKPCTCEQIIEAGTQAVNVNRQEGSG